MALVENCITSPRKFYSQIHHSNQTRSWAEVLRLTLKKDKRLDKATLKKVNLIMKAASSLEEFLLKIVNQYMLGTSFNSLSGHNT